MPAWRWLQSCVAAQRLQTQTTSCGGDASGCWAARSSRSATRGRCTWSADRVRGCIDAEGNAYLDAYNNVPVVGHAHPRVTDAIARQAALLNTNTRYLHATIVELAERIVASMPAGLDTVMFVNSGSEANDLAWRLATIVTGADAGPSASGPTTV